MNKLHITALLAVTTLAFSTGAMAQQVMSKDTFKAGEKNIEAEYKAAKTVCNSLAANAKDICVAQAKGREKVAKAELEANYKPSQKANYGLRVAKAEADYKVAKEMCDDRAGNDKDVCVKEAKAALVLGKSEAKAQMKTSKADTAANKTSNEAYVKADKKGTEAHKKADADQNKANYAVDKEKCDDKAGDAKKHCMDAAKMQHGK